jgi:hypothetical protein
VKETVISSTENTRVIRLGAVRVDYRVEKLVRQLLKCSESRNLEEWKARRQQAWDLAHELGWNRNDLGNWERE